MSQLRALQHRIGLDRAIAYTVLARLVGILGSTGTVLLIVRFMGPVEQGYYYVLLSLISLRLVFELGATLVITQMAAHECVHLTFHPDGSIAGDPVAQERLASLLQQTVRWFSCAGALMAALLLPAGWCFLADRHASGTVVHWQWPWVLAVLVTASQLVLESAIAFLEGCGQIRQVAAMRIWQTAAAFSLAWPCLALGCGLFAPAAVNLACSAVGAAFLWRRRRFLGALLHRSPAHALGRNAISWRAEVWPFQWRIAISTLCAYCTTQIFTPIVFAARGPIEAGQIGMSMSIAGYLGSIVVAWMSTKAPVFGGLVANRDFETLDSLFFRTLRQSLPLLVAMTIGCEAAVYALQTLLPHVAARMVHPAIFALLLGAALSSYVVQSQGMYLRAFKREPFLLQSLAVSAVTILLCLLLVKPWGNTGVAVSYLVGTGIVGLATATAIFQEWRRNGARRQNPDLVAS